MLIICLFAVRFILCCLPDLLCLTEAYISQAPLLTGFLTSQLKGRQEGEKPEHFSVSGHPFFLLPSFSPSLPSSMSLSLMVSLCPWWNLQGQLHISLLPISPSPLGILASLLAQLVKILPAMAETWVRSLGWEDPLEKGKTTHSSILVWRIPWTVQSWT